MGAKGRSAPSQARYSSAKKRRKVEGLDNAQHVRGSVLLVCLRPTLG